MLESAPEKRAFTPCTSGTSESEFDQANRILRMKVGVLVSTASQDIERGQLRCARNCTYLFFVYI